MKDWESLPAYMKNDKVLPYYDLLKKKGVTLLWKRAFDVAVGVAVAAVLIPVIAVLCVMVKADSKGPAFFLQKRVTQYGREFHIIKIRTMVQNAGKLGTEVTSKNDARVTKIGKKLRKYRLDELPQIFNIIKGDMTFVGTRPETPKYVARYTDEMLATLLLRAGLTSPASIQFKDEEEMMSGVQDTDKVYVEKVLPLKMEMNLKYLQEFSLKNDMKVLLGTVKAVGGGDEET